ncbi:MAG: hypothetical protein FWG00_03640 [Coriobacteriia bacterium]|nr:hypothetical protein [Coriobacteriia bacterium]
MGSLKNGFRKIIPLRASVFEKSRAEVQKELRALHNENKSIEKTNARLLEQNKRLIKLTKSLEATTKELKNEMGRNRSALVGKMTQIDGKIARSNQKMIQMENTLGAVDNALCQKIVTDAKKQIKENGTHRSTKNKKICILAFESFHAFIVNSIIEISNPQDNYVEVITVDSIKTELEYYLGANVDKVFWAVLPESKGRSKEKNLALRLPISSLVAELKQWDMVIIPSFEYYYEEYAPLALRASKDMEVVAMIHNINYTLRSEKTNPRLYELLQSVSSYAVLESLLIEEIAKFHLTDKKVHEFPIVFHEAKEKPKPKNKDMFTFVIPGVVQETRRNYGMVLEAFSNLSKHYDKLNLVLLGPTEPYGKDIAEKCKTLKENGFAVQFYESFVPAEIYREIMQDADYILGPMNVHYQSATMDETYGVTKATGITTNMVEYTKPGIVPDDLQMPERLASSTLYYQSSKQLEELVVSLLDRKVADDLAAKALENSRKYSLDNYLL